MAVPFCIYVLYKYTCYYIQERLFIVVLQHTYTPCAGILIIREDLKMYPRYLYT